jgi:phospholipid/cholesterol/gamma-HCH transport system permease protein
MRAAGEVHVLDAQGLDPFTYLVLPRVIGMAVSVFCLTVVFIAVALCSGFVSGLLLGAPTGGPDLFVQSVLGAVHPADLFNVLAKTFIPGLLTGAICCTEGLSIRGSITEVPQATTRGLVRSIGALFVTSVIVSVLTYV